MQTRIAVHAAVIAFVLGGFALVADAMVVSDEEAVEELIEQLATGEGVGAVVSWVDVSREGVRVQTDGSVRRFGGSDGDRAAAAVGDALAPFDASEVDVIQRSIEVDGDRASVSVRARADGELHDARFELARSGQGWLITSLTAR